MILPRLKWVTIQHVSSGCNALTSRCSNHKCGQCQKLELISLDLFSFKYLGNDKANPCSCKHPHINIQVSFSW